VATYLNLAQIVLGAALIVAIVLQSKEAGLGGFMGGEAGGVFRARRGVEKTLFQITIVLSVLFFAMALINVMVVG
jgi:preprotein translocase subunit SecG